MESMILDAGFAYRDVLRSVPDAMVAVSTVSVGNGWKPRRKNQLKIRIRIHGGPDIIIITWAFFFTVIIRPDDPETPKKDRHDNRLKLKPTHHNKII